MIALMTVEPMLPFPSNVDALCLTSDGPLWLHGHASETSDGRIELALASPISDPLEGSKIIVTSPENTSPMITMYVERKHNLSLFLRVDKIHPRDQRLFPRHFGHVPMRYRLTEFEEGELLLYRWKREGIDPGGDWRSPEPFMNFSVSGVSFECATPADLGQQALVELGVGNGENRWYIIAEVARCLPVEDRKLFEIALQFKDIPMEARNALSELTLSIQDALL